MQPHAPPCALTHLGMRPDQLNALPPAGLELEGEADGHHVWLLGWGQVARPQGAGAGGSEGREAVAVG